MLEYLFNKDAAGLKAWNFIKKRLQHYCFAVKLAKILRTPFFIEHLWNLLLNAQYAVLSTWLEYLSLLSMILWELLSLRCLTKYVLIFKKTQ